jgi:cyclopropane-fatty-acyl-phospholipid synthase
MEMTRDVADQVAPLIEALLGDFNSMPVRFWDHSTLGPETDYSIVIKNPNALRRMLWSPGELGLARAYVAGEVDLEGDVFQFMLAARMLAGASTVAVHSRIPYRLIPRAVATAARLGGLGLPPSPPKEEARLGGSLHSKRRDALAISHHYDVGNDFYALFLGDTMTYSCAYFEDEDMTLDEAQTAKYDLICRKLGLKTGMRLLDIGCGWGGMALHAAGEYGARVVGVTLSRSQVDWARRKVEAAGLSDQIDIRYQDYRDIVDGPYDAVSSIGMFEHVGEARLTHYFERVHSLLGERGRLLNHAISSPGGTESLGPRSFMGRYVFPDGELHEVGRVVSSMQQAGFEVRDVESLREHYATTLRHWVERLERSWDSAVKLVGEPRARIWRLYMAGSAVNFQFGSISVHQVLGIKPSARGESGMDRTRRQMLERHVAAAGGTAIP